MFGGIRLLGLAAILAMCCVAWSQAPTPPPSQSPRQAVIEMITGGPEAIKQHLTVEVQQKVNATDANSAANPFAFLESMKNDGIEFESFPAGPLLFSINNPRQHKKIEVHIESEEIRSGTDQMDLSFVSFENGKEQSVPIDFHMVLGLKLQEGIWRLNSVTTTIKFPVGDPRFFDNNFWISPQSADDGANPAGNLASSLLGVNGGTAKTVKQKIPVVRALRLIGLAETIYQRQHPQTGFTCKLTDLINIGKGVGIGDTDASYSFIDAELASGKYNGYHFALSGCNGTPAASFHVIAEPLSGAGRAYCSDPSHTLRASDDGRGATCILAGKPTLN